MKPEVVKAWACSCCQRVFRMDSKGLGKTQAEGCCTCPKCGGQSAMLGGTNLCKVCAAEASVQRCKESVEAAKLNLELSQKVLTSAEKHRAKGA